jgi:LysR family glycine cleavage system transcriptional activator
LPPLNALRAFEAAARHENLSRAAEELGVTHGAISRQVAVLEDWLRTRLFLRTATQFCLTEAGQRYARQITPALDRLSVASLELLDGASPQKLRISAPPTFVMRWLIPLMSRFQREHPEVEIRITTSIAPINFAENSYDLAVRSTPGLSPGSHSGAFITETVAPVSHGALRDKPGLATPADLARHTLIRHATASFTWSDWLQGVGCADLKPAASLGFEQMYLSLQAACEGLGVALVPLFLVVDDIAAGRLAAPFGMLGALKRSYYYACPPHPLGESAAPAFCEWLVEEGRRTEQAVAAWARQMGW